MQPPANQEQKLYSLTPGQPPSLRSFVKPLGVKDTINESSQLLPFYRAQLNQANRFPRLDFSGGSLAEGLSKGLGNALEIRNYRQQRAQNEQALQAYQQAIQQQQEAARQAYEQQAQWEAQRADYLNRVQAGEPLNPGLASIYYPEQAAAQYVAPLFKQQADLRNLGQQDSYLQGQGINATTELTTANPDQYAQNQLRRVYGFEPNNQIDLADQRLALEGKNLDNQKQVQDLTYAPANQKIKQQEAQYNFAEKETKQQAALAYKAALDEIQKMPGGLSAITPEQGIRLSNLAQFAGMTFPLDKLTGKDTKQADNKASKPIVLSQEGRFTSLYDPVTGKVYAYDRQTNRFGDYEPPLDPSELP